MNYSGREFQPAGEFPINGLINGLRPGGDTVGGFIPEEVLENVRMRADIVQVISDYVHLQKKGKNYVGNCPFHQETSPSFTVTPEKQMFYCFGCSAGGNVFRFIMLQHNVTFPEAVKMLGERFGVAVPDGYSPKMREKLRREERAWKINALARDYFYHTLVQRPQGAEAREYLAGRGITTEIISDFKLGYASPGWDDLIKYMQSRGIGVRDLLDVGLAVSRDRKLYDRFRSRLMFPISDALGRVAGFGGRVLGEGMPKYLNTPETDFFSKGRVLYGLDRARRAIREAGYVIITEGYMDTIAAHQYGIANTVAALGTSMTREHGRLLVNYAREVIIAFDADAAGVAAALRGLEMLQELGCRVRVLGLPEGKDPDEFLRARGVEEFKRQIELAAPLVEFRLQKTLEKHDNAHFSKEAALEEMLPVLAAINNELERNEAVKLVAARLYTGFHVVADELRRFSNQQRKKWTKSDNITNNKHNIISKKRSDFGERAEFGLLRLMLEDPGRINAVAGELPGNFFKNPFCRRVYDKILSFMEHTGFGLSVLFDYLEEEDQQRLSALLMEPVPGNNIDAILTGYVSAIKRRELLESRNQLQQALVDAEKSGDRDEVARILHQIYSIDRSLKGGKTCHEGRPK